MTPSSLLRLLMVFLFLVSGDCSSTHQCGHPALCHCDGSVAKCENVTFKSIPKLPNSITHIILERIHLGKLNRDTFKHNKNLKIKGLRVAFCEIVGVSAKAFKGLEALEELDLTGNKNLNANQLAQSFFSIQRNKNLTLILDRCGLTEVDEYFFDGLKNSNIISITMRHNRMKEYKKAIYDGLKTLKQLDLSVNWIKNISYSGTQSSIENLTLADNEFYLFPPFLCNNHSHPDFPKLKALDFSNNFITVPRNEDWYCLKKLEVLNLSRNAFQIIEDNVFANLTSLKTLHLSHMLRKIDIIHPLAFNSSSLTELRFQNNIEVFKPGSDVNVTTLFKYLPKLKSLHLGHNNLECRKDELVEMLSPLQHLEELNLNSTQLESIPSDLFSKFENLSKLYLGGNKIQNMSSVALENITKLKALDISANKIIEVGSQDITTELQESLEEINLADNPFSCDKCDNMWFRNWIEKHVTKFPEWPKMYYCHSPIAKSRTNLEDYKPAPGDCKENNPMTIAYITISVFLCMAIIFGTAGYRGRWYIRYWIIKLKWRFFPSSSQDDPERQGLLKDKDDAMYDAYVIYYDTDRSFVRGKLLPLMEEQFQYKLFILDREPEQGANVDIMVESIYKSNHVIAVISRHFLRDQWCEFQLAVSIDRQVELKRDFLFLVQLEDVDKRLLSKSWCVLFTKTPTAEWSDTKNSIKRKLFEKLIQRSIHNSRFPRQLSTNSEMGD